MSRGYTHARLGESGAGAREVWSAVAEAVDGGDGQPGAVGTVRQVFDRSAYLEFDADALAVGDRLGPPLVLLGNEAFDGPLASRVRTGDAVGFRPDGLSVGDRCTLRRDVRGDPVLSVGDALDLVVSPQALRKSAADPVRYCDLGAMAVGSAPYRRAVTAVERLERARVEDGLGWFDDVTELAAGNPPAGDLASVIEGWCGILAGVVPADEPPTALLGRGPGATPSGDDVLSGLLVALVRTTTGARLRRVRAAGRAIVAAASGRTTSVSSALIAQAAQGRAAGRTDEAVRSLLGADEPPEGWPAMVLDATRVGHTSGTDLLLGTLVVPLAIGPAVADVG